MQEIILNLNRKDFEELYFRDGHEKIFFSPRTKESTILFIIFMLIFVACFTYSNYTNQAWGFTLFLIIPLLTQTLIFGIKLISVIKWRNTIHRYLDEITKYKNNKIILTENSFSLITDSRETIELWTNFKQVEINQEYISLFGENNYCIPKKSTKEEDYELLKTMIRNKVQMVNNTT